MMTRAIIVDVVFDDGMPGPQSAAAWGVDAGPDGVVRSSGFKARMDAAGNLVGLDGADELSEQTRSSLDGVLVGRGFRRQIMALGSGGPGARLLRRLLWELPIVTRISGRAMSLDHSSQRERQGLPRANRFALPTTSGSARLSGVNQCSGWREGGQLVTLISSQTGPKRFPLGPERPPRPPAAAWLPQVPTLSGPGMRRSRVITVDDDAISLSHRDWYPDPDGVMGALHEWDVTARLERENGATPPHYKKVEAKSGELPWPECPSAGRSGSWLEGRTITEVEQAITGEFLGIGTCTHLNDALRMLADVSDLRSE